MPVTKTQTYRGSCFCGNIKFELKTLKQAQDFAIRRCQCSFCTKTGARYISDPKGELIVHLKDENRVNLIQFGTKTADFAACLECGAIPLAISNIDGQVYGIININALDEAANFNRHAIAMDYDDESKEQRLARRKQNWIGAVRFD